MSLSVSCDSRVCWTSAYRRVRHSTVHVSSRTAQRFTILHLHSPASPRPASTSFFPFNLSPAHLHVCRQGDISRFLCVCRPARPSFSLRHFLFLSHSTQSLIQSPLLSSLQRQSFLPRIADFSRHRLPESLQTSPNNERAWRCCVCGFDLIRHHSLSTSFLRPPHSCLSIPTPLRRSSTPGLAYSQAVLCTFVLLL